MKIFISLISLLIFLALSPCPALAVQIHGPPEGLYVHIMGHLLFIAAIIFFLVLIWRNPPAPYRPWRYLKLSLIFFLLWNIDTLIAHYLSLKIPEEALHTPLEILEHRLLPPYTAEKIFYYILRNDHLLCVPAMFFLVMGLKAFAKSGPASERELEA